MPISPYIRELRRHVGTAPLLIPSVSVHVFDDGHRLLLVRQVDGNHWSTPGGAIEPGEMPADAAVREAWEETGLVVRPERLVGVYAGPHTAITYANGDQVQYVITAMSAVVIGGTLRPDHEETVDARYWSLREARNLKLSSWLHALLDMVYAGGTGTGFEAATWRPPTVD